MRRILFLAMVLGCATHHAAPATTAQVAVGTPPPVALAATAAKFGLDMLGDFAWTPIDRNATRFDWSGHPAGRDDVEVLWSFWMEKMDPTEQKLLENLVIAAAANLTEDQHSTPREVFDQPADMVHVFGFDRVISACFTPFEGYGKGKKNGYMHAIVKNGSLSIVAVFSNDLTGVVPLPAHIGARGRR